MNLIVYQTKIYKNQTFADLALQKESTGVIRHVFRPLKLLPSYQLVVNAFLNTKKKNSNNVINFCVGIMKDQSHRKQVSTQQEWLKAVTYRQGQAMIGFGSDKIVTSWRNACVG